VHVYQAARTPCFGQFTWSRHWSRKVARSPLIAARKQGSSRIEKNAIGNQAPASVPDGCSDGRTDLGLFGSPKKKAKTPMEVA